MDSRIREPALQFRTECHQRFSAAHKDTGTSQLLKEVQQHESIFKQPW